MVLYTLIGKDHHTSQGEESVILALIDKETDLEEYSPHDPNLKPSPPALMTRWVQIRLLYWI